MGNSSLMGIERAAAVAAGRDSAALGPSDTSDSGSDLIGQPDSDFGDPGLPVDVAMRDDASPNPVGSDQLGDATGGPTAADIGVDRVVSVAGEADEGEEGDDEHEDADLAFVDEAIDEPVGEGAGMDEDDGIPGGATVDLGPVDPDRPARPVPPDTAPHNHEPKGPGPLPGAPSPDPDDDSEDDHDRQQHRPGRDD